MALIGVLAGGMLFAPGPVKGEVTTYNDEAAFLSELLRLGYHTVVEGFECSEGTADEEAQLKRVQACDARIDVLHFEQRIAAGEPDEQEEMFDPSALLIVLETLVDLCDGVAVDPQSGTIM